MVSTGPSALKDNDLEINTDHRKPRLRPRTLVEAGENRHSGAWDGCGHPRAEVRPSHPRDQQTLSLGWDTSKGRIPEAEPLLRGSASGRGYLPPPAEVGATGCGRFWEKGGRSRVCPAGGRDGQGVSLLCHPATHAYICITAPKLGRRGWVQSLAPLTVLSHAPSSRKEWGWAGGGSEIGSWQPLVRDPWPPTLFPLILPTFSTNDIHACPPDPSCSCLGLALVRNLQGPQWPQKEGRAGTLPTLPGYPGTLPLPSSSHTDSQPASYGRGLSQGSWCPQSRSALLGDRAPRPLGSGEPAPRVSSPDALNPPGPDPSLATPPFPTFPPELSFLRGAQGYTLQRGPAPWAAGHG